MGIWTTVMTTEGLAMLAASAGQGLLFTGCRCGDGSVDSALLPAQGDVSGYKAALDIIEVGNEGSTAKIRVRLDNGDIAQGFYLRQIGLFASAGGDAGLFAIAQASSAIYIPSSAEMPDFITEYVLNFSMGDAGEASGNIDPAAYVTASQLEGCYRYRRQLTPADNLDDITDSGVYFAGAASLPQGAPFADAFMLMVEGSASASGQKVQRAVRCGAAGQAAFRALASGEWQDWAYIAAADASGNISLANGAGIKAVTSGGNIHNVAYVDTSNVLHIGSKLAQAGAQSLATEIEGLKLRLTNLEKINNVQLSAAYSVFGAAAAGHGHHAGTLSSADDLDTVTAWGSYYTATASLPAHSPFENAYILFVFGNGGLGTVQLAARWAADGQMAMRVLGSTNKTWKFFTFS